MKFILRVILLDQKLDRMALGARSLLSTFDVSINCCIVRSLIAEGLSEVSESSWKGHIMGFSISIDQNGCCLLGSLYNY